MVLCIKDAGCSLIESDPGAATITESFFTNERQTDRQRDRQTDRQRQREAETETDRQTETERVSVLL